jgi:YD repeat-containing protein|tara:strand:- start:92 stop:439 length:348 start_codon:yes stop_codon:yes gene_type:complete
VKVLGDSFMDKSKLDYIDHVAVQVLNIRKGISYYRKNYKCEVLHEDESWALLEFQNTKLALVLPYEHPAHFAVIDDKLEGGVTHRDGSRSTYVHDHQGNMIERITYKDTNENKSK